LGKKRLKLAVELSRQGFIVAQHKGRPVDPCKHIGHGKSFPRSGNAQKGLIPISPLKPFNQLIDGLGLIACWLKFGNKGKLHDNS